MRRYDFTYCLLSDPAFTRRQEVVFAPTFSQAVGRFIAWQMESGLEVDVLSVVIISGRPKVWAA